MALTVLYVPYSLDSGPSPHQAARVVKRSRSKAFYVCTTIRNRNRIVSGFGPKFAITAPVSVDCPLAKLHGWCGLA